MYSELKLDHVVRTLRTLESRIAERFPDSGLSQVAAELRLIAEDTGPVIDRIRRPHQLIRAGVYVVVGLIIALVVVSVYVAVHELSLEVDGFGALLQSVESAAQNLIFLSIAVYFCLTIESRINRRISLRALHRLRSIIHIVDMHQLTKDPEHLLSPGMRTASSPQRRFSRFELVRYLDYCSELLSLGSKLAALHVQYINDPVVLDAVNDIEVLASNLSNQIWQKIMILDSTIADSEVRDVPV